MHEQLDLPIYRRRAKLRRVAVTAGTRPGPHAWWVGGGSHGGAHGKRVWTRNHRPMAN